MTDDQFIARLRKELRHARTKFPENAANHAALIEEVGELAKALMYEPWNNVVAEAVQVACMAVRIATEGDSTMKDFRNHRVHANGRRYTPDEFVMPGMTYSCRESGEGYTNVVPRQEAE